MSLLPLFLLLTVSMQVDPEGPSAPPALQIHEGSIARQQVVALGRDLVVAGEALSEVVTLDGSIRISGRVAGDAIALGGDVVLTPTARVEGDVFALGGVIEASSGSYVGGRSAAYPTVSSAWLTLMEGPSLGLAPTSPLVVATKLALLASWLVLVLLFSAISGREVLATSESASLDPFRNFYIGVTAVLAMVLTGLALNAFLPPLVGVPLVAVVILVALGLKLWGMVAVFHAVGDWLARSLLRRHLQPLNAATVGLAALGALKLLPWIGVWTWSLATLIGVGAALESKFGRREPWFQVMGGEPVLPAVRS
jgi:hypothetical protein